MGKRERVLPLPKVADFKPGQEPSRKRGAGSSRGKTGSKKSARPGTPGRQPTTDVVKHKKKPGTPTPYVPEDGLPKARPVQTAKPARKAANKKVLLHQQPRQHSIAGTARGESVRSSTPLAQTLKVLVPSSDESGSKVVHPGPPKVAVFYTNLMKAREEGKTRLEPRLLSSRGLGIPPPSAMPSPSTLFTGLEQAAQKKLNKHSSSLDNTDWMACYEKARKGLNPGSPLDAQLGVNRVTSNGTRPAANHVVLIAGCRLPRPLLTPTAASRPPSEAPSKPSQKTETAGLAGSKNSWAELKSGGAESKMMRGSGSQKFLQKVMQRQGQRANPLVVSLLRKQHRETQPGQDQGAPFRPKLAE